MGGIASYDALPGAFPLAYTYQAIATSTATTMKAADTRPNLMQ